MTDPGTSTQTDPVKNDYKDPFTAFLGAIFPTIGGSTSYFDALNIYETNFGHLYNYDYGDYYGNVGPAYYD